MDLLKTYLTINQNTDAKVTITQQAKFIYKEFGIMGFYKGWGISMMGIAPFIGIKMATFDLLMNKFSPDRTNPYVAYYNLLLGAASGTIAVTITYPTDLTRRLMQLNGTPGHNYSSIPDVIMQLWRKEGFFGFYKGLWATYLKVAPMVAILFYTNEQLKRMAGI